MGVFNYNEGCGNNIGCFGPKNPYYTIFNTELSYIHYPLVFSLIPTAIFFIILFVLKKKNVINWTNKKIILLLIMVYMLSFIWFANWSWIVY